MKFHVPIRLPSLTNVRMHWRALLKMKQSQKLATFCAIQQIGGRKRIPRPPLIVTITRIGPRKLDDDNLPAACKYVRDQIAHEIGVDDGSPLYTWQYLQRKGKYGVDVEITPRRLPDTAQDDMAIAR